MSKKKENKSLLNEQSQRYFESVSNQILSELELPELAKCYSKRLKQTSNSARKRIRTRKRFCKKCRAPVLSFNGKNIKYNKLYISYTCAFCDHKFKIYHSPKKDKSS